MRERAHRDTATDGRKSARQDRAGSAGARPVLPVRALLLPALLFLVTSSRAQGAPDAGAARPPVKAAAPAPAVPGQNVPAVKVNTVGYPPDWKKIAIFNREPRDLVVTDAQGAVALRIAADRVEARGIDPASQDPVWQVDLSALTVPGRYQIAGAGHASDPFEVGPGVYDRVLVAGLKSFYFQRTRTALTAPHAVWEGELFARPAAPYLHEDVGWDLTEYPQKKRRWKLEAGWHDAGNYDLYVPSEAPTAHGLLLAYEHAPARFGDGQLNIPESGNGVPDLLDEAKWGLRWVLSMQDRNGGFRHRESVLRSSPHLPPHEDRTERWVAGLSTAATAKAVAALATAARIYRRWDGPFAARAARAARRGFAYLLANPRQVRADRRGGGGQPLWDDEPNQNDVGARFIAGVEMWRSFGDRAGLRLVRQLVQTAPELQPEKFLYGAWANLARWGLVALAEEPKAPADLRAEARRRLLAAVEPLRARVERDDGYRCASSLDDYYWAHNSNLLEKAHLLAVAAGLAPDRPWLTEAARDQWHWLLGRNPNGHSMITRVGRGPARFYHLEWGPREPPPPGYVIGGPNALSLGFLAPGAPAKALLWDNPAPLRAGTPAHALWHWRQTDLWDGGFAPEGDTSTGWWTVTEPDIFYNANLALVAVRLQ